jgi:anti-anti-sigma factor
MLVELEHRDDVCILRVKGRIAPGADSESLRRTRDEIRRRHCSKILADFREVPSIGSTGISFVVSIFDLCGGRFVLAGPHRRVREVLEITRLSGVLPLAPDVASGLAALRGVL